MKSEQQSKSCHWEQKARISRAKAFFFFFLLAVIPPVNLYTKLCLLNWSYMRWSAFAASLIWYSVRQACLDDVCSFKRRQNRTWWFVANDLTASAFVVTWSSRDHHVIIWISQNPADFLRLSPCVNVKLIHVDRSDRKMSMPPDLNTEVHSTKTQPIAAQLATFPPLYLCFYARCGMLMSIVYVLSSLCYYFLFHVENCWISRDLLALSKGVLTNR